MMPHRIFKRKSNRTSTYNLDDEFKAEFSPMHSHIRYEAHTTNILIKIPNRIFIGGLSLNTHEWDIRAEFSRYGNVKFVKIIKDNMGTSKGYGFVTFATEEEAKNIIKKAQVIIKGRKLNIAPAVKKQIKQADFHSAEISSVASLHEISSSGSIKEKIGNQSSVGSYYSRGVFNTDRPYVWQSLQASGFLGTTALLNSPANSEGNSQMNCILPYPVFVCIPQYPYQYQATGYIYSTGGSFPDFMHFVPVPASAYINTDLK